MAHELKSTSFGIPYFVEFANLTFRRRRKKRNSKRSQATHSIYSTPDFSDSDWTLVGYDGSSETLSAHSRFDKPEIEEQGLYIRFASSAASSSSLAGSENIVPRQLSPTRAMRLKHRIASAVLKAGMDAGSEEAADPLDCALRQRGALPPAPASCFYRGTYGQVMQAFQSAGLTATACDEAGFPNATRLGAMFVVNQTSRSRNVELMKVTLWA
ncbi:hypothetical protein PHLGIDRAFT_121410 [Phlebiopsis gigantea 11061_1 CR5-6]|uniref:Uncharacterized protein n=1 Tax=Phlebiopsis gigantea (strain 11061_1 CR5-6) TaxID=745531 RepID=A0A0C3PDZ5_PHLG1|nr:hypothetical protein PHLGIDRAFT_121410 [Phlebiopsis gigantea 11061_1 CR5-6]